MELSVEDIRLDLEKQGYQWHDGFSHQSIVPSVRRYFFKLNIVIIVFWVAQLVSLLLAVEYGSSSEQPLRYLLLFLAGMACFVMLIPLHELLHGAGYRLFGAPKVEYRLIWKQFVFYAIADRFVTRKVPFVVLALLPFVVINTLLFVLLVVLPEAWSSWVCGALFMHVAGCSGDFALLSYFLSYWNRDPVTFDDAVKGESHFFIRPRTLSGQT